MRWAALVAILILATSCTAAQAQRPSIPGYCKNHPTRPGCPTTTVTTPPPTSPPPSGECVGVQVPPGANLQLVIHNGLAQTYCLAAGTYELGSTPLQPDNNDVIIGQPVTFGPNGEVAAPTKIHGTASVPGIISTTSGVNALTLENLDICCSPRSDSQNASGRGVAGLPYHANTLVVRNSRIHGNQQSAIGGFGPGLLVEHSEIDHNGINTGGYDAGIKTINFAVIRSSYFHDNSGNGMWWDCDAPGGVIEGSRIDANSRSGVFIEISSGEGAGFTVRNNHVEGNNASAGGNRAGIDIISSKNVLVDGNTVIRNGLWNINVNTDSRSGNGHNGCSSGFVPANVTVSNNQYGPQPLQGTTLSGTTWINNTKIL